MYIYIYNDAYTYARIYLFTSFHIYAYVKYPDDAKSN